MIELIDRAELPMQPLSDRNGGISGTVPVYLGVEALSTEIVRGVLDVGSATETVRDWYNHDMDWYLGSLRDQGYDTSHLSGFEEYKDTWQLDAEPSDLTNLLQLTWRKDEVVHVLRHDPVPVVFHNQHDESGAFYTPDFWVQQSIFPIVYRGVFDPVFLFMDPEKMRQFGHETPDLHATINPEARVAEVVGSSFECDYKDNLAEALLLRNYGVYYMNQLAAELPATD